MNALTTPWTADGFEIFIEGTDSMVAYCGDADCTTEQANAHAAHIVELHNASLKTVSP